MGDGGGWVDGAGWVGGWVGGGGGGGVGGGLKLLSSQQALTCACLVYVSHLQVSRLADDLLLLCPQMVCTRACIPGDHKMLSVCSTDHERAYACCTACTANSAYDLFCRGLALQPYFPAEAARLLELLAPPTVRKPQLPSGNPEPVQEASRPASTGGPVLEPMLPQLQAADAALQAARQAAAAALAASIAMHGLAAAPDKDGPQEAQQQQEQLQTEQQPVDCPQQQDQQQQQKQQQQHVGSPSRPATVSLQKQRAHSLSLPMFAAAAAGTTAALAAGGSSTSTPSCSGSALGLPRVSRPSPSMMGLEPALSEQDIAPGVKGLCATGRFSGL